MAPDAGKVLSECSEQIVWRPEFEARIKALEDRVKALEDVNEQKEKDIVEINKLRDKLFGRKRGADINDEPILWL